LKQFSIINAEILAKKLNMIKVKYWYKNLLSIKFCKFELNCIYAKII
jgi:hypothetical protein